jgi:hypothetical protein
MSGAEGAADTRPALPAAARDPKLPFTMPVANERYGDVGVDGPRRHQSCQAVNVCNAAKGAVP